MAKNFDACAFRVIMPVAVKAEQGADVSFKIQFQNAVHQVYFAKCSVSDRFGKKYEAVFLPETNGKSMEKIYKFAVVVQAEKPIYTTEGKMELELLDLTEKQKVDIMYTIKRSGPYVLEQVDVAQLEEGDMQIINQDETGDWEEERPRRRRKLSYVTRREE